MLENLSFTKNHILFRISNLQKYFPVVKKNKGLSHRAPWNHMTVKEITVNIKDKQFVKHTLQGAHTMNSSMIRIWS